MWQECDDFRSRGITGTGAGFDALAAGRVGGAGFGAHNPDPSQLRDKMLKARATGCYQILSRSFDVMFAACLLSTICSWAVVLQGIWLKAFL